MCGTLEREWDEDRFAYTAQIHKCPGCELRSFKQDELREVKAEGMTVRLVRAGTPEAKAVRAAEAAAAKRAAADARAEKAARRAALEQKKADREVRRGR